MALCSGILADIKGRLPWYVDDWTTGFKDKKVPAATLFIFFAQMFPAVTFGYFLAERTRDGMGVIETLLSMAIGGTIQALFAGQPLVVVGVTGPVALFCAMLFDLSAQWAIPYHGWLFWTCFWAAMQHIALAAFNACDLVRWCTDFSGDCFGFLISIIYLYEGIVEFAKVFSGASTLDAPLLTLLLGLGHLWLASALGRARSWTVLPKGARALAADYGPSISIIMCALVPVVGRLAEIDVPTLRVPSSFHPSTPRPWVFVESISATPVWAVFAAIIPATILTLLLFFDHNISSMLSQRPAFGLKKPSSYNYDFALLGVILLVTGLLGLPPNYGLIPQAPLHVRSLAKIKDVKNGVLKREVWLRVCETRVSAFGQSLLLFAMLSEPLLGALGRIPKGVLAGLFLHISLSGLQGNNIADRLCFLVMDTASRAGVTTAWACLPWRSVVYFTLLQLMIAACIFAVTLTQAGIVFPVLIVLLVPIRLYLLPQIFKPSTLGALDPCELPAQPNDEGCRAMHRLDKRVDQAILPAAQGLSSDVVGAVAAGNVDAVTPIGVELIIRVPLLVHITAKGTVATRSNRLTAGTAQRMRAKSVPSIPSCRDLV